MLKKNKNTDIISLKCARTRIPKMKAIFVIQDMSDLSDIQGYISYISEAEDSYDDLIKEYRNFKRQNQQAMVIGSYENGGAVGVQYDI